MALLDAPLDTDLDGPRVATAGGTATRLGWRDVVGLSCLLLALLALMPLGPFTTDEGEVLLQLEVLVETGGWEAPHPASALDPSGEHMPVHQIERDGERFLPHVKHPVWTQAMVPVFAAGGLVGVVGVHLAALVLTAWAAAIIARRLGSGRERQVFWVVGIASPVTVGAFVAWGHAPGAAAASLSIALLATTSGAPHRRQVVDWSVGAAALVVGVLIRNEVVLVGLSLCAVLVVRRQWRPALTAAIATAGGYLLNSALMASIWGPDAAPFRVIDRDAGWLAGRITGATRTLLGFEPTLPAALVAVAAVVGGWLTARSSPRTGGARLGLVLTLGAPVASVAWWPVEPVAGLLVVCPLMAVALGPGPSRWRGARRGESATVAGVAVVTVALVLATQYSDGGGLQWGGRFLHVVVPTILALVLSAAGGSDPGPDSAAVCRIPKVVIAAAGLWTFAGLLSVWHLRSLNHTVVDAVVAQARADADAGDVTGPPVVLGDLRVLGALAWDHLDDLRAMDARPVDLEELAGRLETAGVDRWTLVWTEPDPPTFIGTYRAVDRRTDPTSSLWLVSMGLR